MKELITSMDNLPLVVKVILALVLDIIWHIYRIVKALDANNTTSLIISIVLLFIPFMGLVDVVMLILKGNVLVIENI